MSNQATSAPAAPRRTYLWPTIIIGLLATHATLMIITVFVASSDRSFAVEPDYYQKAVNWDDISRQRVANDELGWSLQWDMSSTKSTVAGANGELKCRLVNRLGVALDGAKVAVELFPHAKAENHQQVALERVGDGWYTGRANFSVPGLWELRAVVQRGPDSFTSNQQLLIAK